MKVMQVINSNEQMVFCLQSRFWNVNKLTQNISEDFAIGRKKAEWHLTSK